MAGGYMTDANKKVTVLREQGRLGLHCIVFAELSLVCWDECAVRWGSYPLSRIMAACPFSCRLGHSSWFK